MLEGNTKGAILVVTYERWHTTTYIGVGSKHFPMTQEVRYIIENKKFKRTKEDFAAHWEFVIPVLSVVFGLVFFLEGNSAIEYVLGAALIILAFPLLSFVLKRSKQLNSFEEFTNNRSQEENFSQALFALKTVGIKSLDKDFHNMTINARYKSQIPPFDEWLTIVCLDNRVLVNCRPEPLTLIFWFRRNAIAGFMKELQ